MKYETDIYDIVEYESEMWTVVDQYVKCGTPHVKIEKGEYVHSGRFAHPAEYKVKLVRKGAEKPKNTSKAAPTQKDTFVKHDTGKAPMDFLYDTPLALAEVCKVQQFGAKKYSRANWDKCTDPLRYRAANLRHLFEQGINPDVVLDEESGLATMAHAIACALFDLEKMLRKNKESGECQKT